MDKGFRFIVFKSNFIIMDDIRGAAIAAAEFLRAKGVKEVNTAVILGTGLGAFAGLIEDSISIPYAEIPGFPLATVETHKGNLIYGTVAGKKVAALQGRFHYYEGYSMQQISFPVRVLKELGAETLLLSNAAGGMNPEYRKGDLVLIEDHINLLPDNPLRGLSDPTLGPRFVDMCAPYQPKLSLDLQEAARNEGVELKKGVYVAVMGPNLETRAEYRWLRSMGADMVGMSTVPEVIVANQVGIACAAISVITDECDPDNLQPVDISEIIRIAGEADIQLSRIFLRVMEFSSGSI